MWLTLEKSAVRHQRRDLGVDAFVDPHPELPGRSSLVLTAAHTVLPEAAVDGLPEIARREVGWGLTGRVREALARCGTPGYLEEQLRDELLAELSGGRSGRVAALVVSDQVHLRRLVRGTVPAVIAAGNLRWYDLHRSPSDPYVAQVGALRRLHEAWKGRPGERRAVEEEMRRTAVSVVGEAPDDLLDVTV